MAGVETPAQLPVGPELPVVDGIEHRVVHTPRLAMHVAEAGAGVPVLLLHGWAQHWYAWRDVIPLLSGHYRVICPDLRGFGWSEAPGSGYGTADLVADLQGLLDALDIDSAYVIGHDLGGRLAFHLALAEPQRIRGLIAAGALHPYWRLRSLLRQARREWWTVFVETPLLGRRVLRHVPAFLRMIFRSSAMSPAQAEYFADFARQPQPARAAEQVMRTFAYREIVPALLRRSTPDRLHVPALLLNGSRDVQLATPALRGFEGHADAMQVREIPGAGHYLPQECPELVADAALQRFAR